ncbi:MAG: hypothetical protein HQK65_16730 [Desulfamplus sp.]|nr:hypothetical protein [Desulfamplus sp.]
MELTSASRARHPAEARAIIALIGMDYCDFSLSDFAYYFNRNMPSMSRLVKDVRTRLAKSQSKSMHERIERIKNQITTISEA